MTTSSDPAAYFGRQVRKARRSHGWSLQEFGQQVVYHPAALSRIENTPASQQICDVAIPFATSHRLGSSGSDLLEQAGRLASRPG
jgi:transcriptional regulator with XRE-family HTH domain